MKIINGPIHQHTDLHLRYPFPKIKDMMFGENVAYTGDIIELVNFNPKYLQETLDFALAFTKKCIETNTTLVKGNHEGGLYNWLEKEHGIKIPDYELVKWNGEITAICHGLHTWKPKRVQKWLDKPLKPDTLFGSRFLKVGFSKMLAKGRLFWKKKKLSKKQIRRTQKFMFETGVDKGLYLDTLIMGHIHPTKHIDEKHYGYRIICSKAGYTVLGA